MKTTGILILIFLFAASEDARRGNEAYNIGDFPAAEQAYRDALRKNPEDIRLYFNLGNALAKQDKFDEAIQSFVDFKMLSNQPREHALADYNIGNIHGMQQDWKQALESYHEALRQNPTDDEAKFNYELANRFLQQNDGGGGNERQEKQEQQEQKNEQESNDGEMESQQMEQPGNQSEQQQGNMSLEEAQSVLNALENKEKELIKDFIKKQIPPQPRHAKDW